MYYGTTGVCKITEIRAMPLGHKGARTCYVLKPIEESGASLTIYVPITSCERALASVFVRCSPDAKASAQKRKQATKNLRTKLLTRETLVSSCAPFSGS